MVKFLLLEEEEEVHSDKNEISNESSKCQEDTKSWKIIYTLNQIICMSLICIAHFKYVIII